MYVYTQNSILHKWVYNTYLLVHVIIKSCNFCSPALQKVSVYLKETFTQHLVCLIFLYVISLSSQYINKGCCFASSPSSWLNYYTLFSLLDSDLQRTGRFKLFWLWAISQNGSLMSEYVWKWKTQTSSTQIPSSTGILTAWLLTLVLCYHLSVFPVSTNAGWFPPVFSVQFRKW